MKFLKENFGRKFAGFRASIFSLINFTYLNMSFHGFTSVPDKKSVFCNLREFIIQLCHVGNNQCSNQLVTTDKFIKVKLCIVKNTSISGSV
jgi:hypothetical protein